MFLSFIILGCSSKEEPKPNYGNFEFMGMAKKGDPNLKIILPGSISETVVTCSDFSPPCRYGMKAIIKNIPLIALYYDSQEEALEVALRNKAYISRNWVLDEVTGEPILERFVVKYLNAVKASDIKKTPAK